MLDRESRNFFAVFNHFGVVHACAVCCVLCASVTSKRCSLFIPVVILHSAPPISINNNYSALGAFFISPRETFVAKSAYKVLWVYVRALPLACSSRKNQNTETEERAEEKTRTTPKQQRKRYTIHLSVRSAKVCRSPLAARGTHTHTQHFC